MMHGRLGRFIAALAVCVLAIGAGAGFMGATAFADEPLLIGAAVYGTRAEYIKLWTTGLERHPAVMDGTVRITVFDGNYDASVQYAQFETMVAQGYDGILFVPIDIEAGAAAVELAYQAGIPVVGSNTRVNSDKLLSYVGSNDVLGGELLGGFVADQLGGRGNVVIIEGPIGQSAQIERRQGILNVLEQYPDINILDIRPGNWSRAEGLQLMENWLVRFRGQIDGIIGENDEMVLGAIQAVKSAGLRPTDFATAGIDGVSDAMIAVQRGELGVSFLQDAEAQSQCALDVLLLHLLGPDYKPLARAWTRYPEMSWTGKVEEHYNVPWTRITKDNVADLLAERLELTTR